MAPSAPSAPSAEPRRPDSPSARRMRLLVCLNEPVLPLSGGGSAGNFHILRELARRGHRVAVASPLEVAPEEAERRLGCRVHPVQPFRMHRTLPWREARYLAYMALFPRRLRRLLERETFDAVLVRNCTLALPVRRECRRRGLPWAISLTDLVTGLLEEDRRYPRPLVHRLMDLERRIAGSADLRFVVSGAMARALDGPGGGSCLLTLDGVDHRAFDPGAISPEAKARATRRIGLPAPFVLYHGIVDPRRGIRRLVRVIRQARDVRFAILANPEGLQRLRPLVPAGRVRLLPFAPYDEVPAYLAAASAVMVPYPPTRALHMVFTLKLLEGLAMGLPVVSYRRRCLEEHLAGCASLLQVDRPEELAAALPRALALPRDLATAERIRRGFSWEAVTARIEAGLLGLLEEREG